MLLGISETANVRTFKPLPLCSAPWKLTGREFWSSRNERKSLSKETCFEEMQWGISEMSNARAVCNSSLLWYWGDFWSSTNTRKPFSKQQCVLTKCCWVSQKQQMWERSNLGHCVQHPWKLTSRNFWNSGSEKSHFLSKNVFWGNAVGYLRNGEC